MTETAKKIFGVLRFIWGIIPVKQQKWILDKGLDWSEDLIKESKNKIDDRLLPLIKIFRDSFGIEDND